MNVIVQYYPIMLNLQAQQIVIIGGGRVAVQKLKSLLAVNYRKIVIVSPEISSEMDILISKYGLTWLPQNYNGSVLNKAHILFVATNDANLNSEISHDALSYDILVCNVSDGSQGNFITPAVARGEHVVVAASTLGGSPSVAKAMRKKLEEQFIPQYDKVSKYLTELRRELLALSLHENIRKQLISLAIDDVLSDESLIDGDITAWIDSLQKRCSTDESEG